MLAPGMSVTLVNAADPSVRVVITAPHHAPLDLAPLLATEPANAHSIVTRMHVREAGAITQQPDGSLVLGNPASAPKATAAPALHGGTLVFNAGSYTLYPAPPAAPVVPLPGQAVAPAQMPNMALPAPRTPVAAPAITVPSPAAPAAPQALPTAVLLPSPVVVPTGAITISAPQPATINFGSFNIGAGGAVNFQQPNASAVVNHVTTGGTTIQGNIRATTLGAPPPPTVTVR
jgi:hypothetical protein